MKSNSPNTRISMPPITLNQDDQYETERHSKASSAVSQASSPDSSSDSDEPPSTFLTKVSKFEYLAAQNLRKSISPKVFSSNAVTMNIPARDVLGKSTNINNLAKHLPQNALNYSELNRNKIQKVKSGEWPFLGSKKCTEYVNVTSNDTNSISNKVVVYENGIKQQNVNIDNREPITKSSSGSKNINIQRVVTPSPGYNRNPDLHFNITPRSVTNNYLLDNSLEQLAYDDPNERKKEAEIKRNQAQQDRIKEQELEKTEQARLEEILNMCAEYEKQSQIEKNKPVTPNRIKTNGSLPRDKRTSPFGTPPASPGVFNFPPPTYSSLPRNKITSNYENMNYSTPDITSNDKYIDESICESSNYKSTPPSHYPSSPRTRIKTFIAPNTEHTSDNTNFLHRKPLDNKELQASYELDSIEPKNPSAANTEPKSYGAVYESLKNEKKLILDVVANIKKLISEIEIQEEELHIEMDLERALLLGEHKCKLLDLDNLRLNKAKLIKRAQNIENYMKEAQHRQNDHQTECQKRLKIAQVNMAEIEQKLASTEKSSEDYEAIFEQYLKSQEVLDGERKSFEDLEFHLLEQEANWLASREELQREIMDLSSRIESLLVDIQELEHHSADTANADNRQYKMLETQKINYLVRLEEMRNKLKHVDATLAQFPDQQQQGVCCSDSDSNKSKESENSEVMKGLSCSMICETSDRVAENINMSHSLHEFNLDNNALIKVELDSKIIENEGKRSQTTHNCASVASTDSEEIQNAKKTQEEMSNASEETNKCGNEEIDQRPLSEVSEMSLEGLNMKKRSRHQGSDKQRPLTRYLPIASSHLDLRQHIESAGHQVVLCPHVYINSTSCKGYLHKKGSKLNSWSKRWFVFDRSKRTFSYFSDRNEKRARGGAYFQAIEEVYIDHLKSAKAPNPHLTFIVKTHQRYYFLLAPSPEAMRIWVDVIFTGAEGYQEFQYENE